MIGFHKDDKKTAFTKKREKKISNLFFNFFLSVHTPVFWTLFMKYGRLRQSAAAIERFNQEYYDIQPKIMNLTMTT